MKPEHFMRQAIALSKESISLGGGPFGAVIVKNNKVIGIGQNTVVKSNDPTAHAEINAIRHACQNINSHDLSGAVIFSSCEPCPMCLSAIWWARVNKIYFGNTRKDASAIGFDDAIIYEELHKPIDKRLLPIEQMLDEEAISAFSEWKKYDAKIPY